MKFILASILFATMLFADSEKLIIDSNNFETDDATGVTIFTGNVKLKKVNDKLNSKKLEIFMKPNSKGKAKEPLKYVATGNVDFEIHSNGKIYKGKGDKVIYNPNTQEYTVIGNGHIKELTEQRELLGEKIFINELTGNAKVSGNEQKPVRFIINIESKNSANESDKNK
ncbi:organic solvent tolerance protein OstA [Halarcobacter ebronensis]|uniref:Organic solvent tolerance protein OstA n=1 Tax=Halarcobacter ebronensis TaxID=1462615 RepID=A0A4Q0YI78_9BACT|nr:LptA/OstA family protein [Halarcobacter ebronensis]QKF82278.1 lipooligosaccharide transport system, periplasmic component LptA [Halarcobacter ebronensis]RXJ70013.1 organic solvent tolerance protein OstA [Halarcobacter ebronensis]RXK07689.1 organic solvent tolerance protein OstA [Halarcobacter ebronensis]